MVLKFCIRNLVQKYLFQVKLAVLGNMNVVKRRVILVKYRDRLYEVGGQEFKGVG